MDKEKEEEEEKERERNKEPAETYLWRVTGEVECHAYPQEEVKDVDF